ncbi:hypothetical protein AB0C13_18870 [Streptomyces sp. NPDC049099]|uniref:hypothetical protein n=1 Tax=Streptomyces sp. NPDC049099 TaxID=3155768 RepID=UPI003432BEBC
MTAPRIDVDSIPTLPLFVLTATPDHRALLDGTPLDVPAGADPRVVAVNAVIPQAQLIGRAVRAELHDAEGLIWPMIITPEGGVLQGNRPLPPPAEETAVAAPAPVARHEAPPVHERPPQAVATQAGAAPQLTVDPQSVPAWPLVTIVMTRDGTVLVNDAAVPVPAGADPRAAGVAAAAEHVTRLGLGRPVRANATEPDGTVWPLLIHPDGTATPTGDAIRPERRRWLRRKN